MFRIGRVLVIVGISESWAISVVAENSSPQGSDEHSANTPIILARCGLVVRTGPYVRPYVRAFIFNSRTYSPYVRLSIGITRTYGPYVPAVQLFPDAKQ